MTGRRFQVMPAGTGFAIQERPGDLMLSDFRYAVRLIRRNPAFSLAVVVALALGIGATTAMFTSVNAILLRPLPYGDPGRLFMVREGRVQPGFARTVVAPGEFLRWREQAATLDGLATVDYPGVTLTIGQEPELFNARRVSVAFLAVLGVRPESGRDLGSDDQRPGGPRVLLISHDLWQRRFASNPGTVGSTVRLDGQPATIVGVLPRGFEFNGQIDAIVPFAPTAEDAADFGHHYLDVVGRLRRGVTPTQAEAELAVIARPVPNRPPHLSSVVLVPLQEELVGAVRPSLLVLFGAVAVVLLIGCVNIASLLVARATAREREISIRVALGAQRGRVARQLMVESLVLALIGGALGVMLSLWAVDLLVAVSPPDTPRLADIGVDWRALVFAVGLTCGVGVFFGLAPAWYAARANATVITARDARGGGTTRSRARLRHALVAGELALALVLLAGAGVLLASLRALTQVEKGFDPTRVLTVPMALPEARYPQPAERRFYHELLARVDALPGVEAAGIVNALPLSGNNSSGTIAIEGHPASRPEDEPNVNLRMISPGYFAAMRIPVLRGRAFTTADDDRGAPVALVNPTMSAQCWPGEDPIGKRVKMGRLESQTPWMTVVGIVGDVRHRALSVPPRAEMYMPSEQQASEAQVLVVRAAGNPTALGPGIRREVHRLDPDLAVTLQPMDQVVSQSLQSSEFVTALVTAFAVTALLLAAGGVYAVMAYAVTLREHEFGVRLALGASRRDIVALVTRQALGLVGIGLGMGVPAAWMAARLLVGMLYQVSPGDPRVLVATSAVLASVGLAATVVPARRAVNVDPVTALRTE